MNKNAMTPDEVAEKFRSQAGKSGICMLSAKQASWLFGVAKAARQTERHYGHLYAMGNGWHATLFKNGAARIEFHDSPVRQEKIIAERAEIANSIRDARKIIRTVGMPDAMIQAFQKNLAALRRHGRSLPRVR